MKTIIAGSRTCVLYDELLNAIASLSWKPTKVLSGTARGVDRMGERWAKENSIEIEKYPADWNRHGKSAGYIRNAEMVKKAEALLALWDGKSRGTKHTIDLAEQKGLYVLVWKVL